MAMTKKIKRKNKKKVDLYSNMNLRKLYNEAEPMSLPSFYMFDSKIEEYKQKVKEGTLTRQEEATFTKELFRFLKS